ncbi:hypothetical protein [Streptosporangium sp. NPDC049046]|uniref:hypothetical protein n=1 Tax=Streptosporangium sp. NPDC049046 TaxID=3155031 RepID=UPI0034251D3F
MPATLSSPAPLSGPAAGFPPVLAPGSTPEPAAGFLPVLAPGSLRDQPPEP